MNRMTVKLTPSEIEFLRAFKSSGKRSQREYDRANILLLLDKGKLDAEIIPLTVQSRAGRRKSLSMEREN